MKLKTRSTRLGASVSNSTPLEATMNDIKTVFPMHLFFMANPTEVLRLCCVVIGVVTIYKKFERFFAHPLLLYFKMV